MICLFDGNMSKINRCINTIGVLKRLNALYRIKNVNNCNDLMSNDFCNSRSKSHFQLFFVAYYRHPLYEHVPFSPSPLFRYFCVNICFVVKDVASAVHRFVTLLNAHSLRHAGKMTRFVMLTKLPWRHNFDVSITGQGWRSKNCPRNDLFLLAQRLEYNQFALQKDFKKILNVVQLR